MAKDIHKIIEKSKGKKGKVKKLKEEPSGTKAQKLSKLVREALEEEFGTDFSQVKVHSGGNITELAESLNASAFTTGTNIYFANESDINDELLARELTHVVQQGGGKVNVPKGKAITSE